MQKFEPAYREPYMQVRNKSLIFYSLSTKGTHQRHHLLNYKTYSGNITKSSGKRLKQKIDLLLQLSPPVLIYNPIIKRHMMHTLSFITLTISSKERHLTAKEGHKLCLEPWLLRMRRKANLKTYIWKAEFQKNGQLHYHITTPSFIDHTLIKNHWNIVLGKANLLSQWDASTGKQPNSTDIHAVYKVKNIQAYLTKYLSKENKDKSTVGKIWDCSLNLKNAKFFSVPALAELVACGEWYETISNDFIDIIKCENPINHCPPKIKKLYKDYLENFKN